MRRNCGPARPFMCRGQRAPLCRTCRHTAGTTDRSLFHQSYMLYDLSPSMPATRLLPLMQRFSFLGLELL
jgi:hypothetical protein